jgi:site-specific DNA-methyltransferase (adenine-specific)
MLETNKIYCIDCIEGMKQIDDNSIDAIVTDPPAGISFMGKEWDTNKGGRDNWIKWMESVAVECLRVLKPGGHALVWSIPRTSHWTATAWENVGFEVRDNIAHIFGTGFPKSLNIGKAIDKLQGNEREVEGWGTALKPAREDWWLLRKPISKKSIAENVLKWGTGGINIDDCRIGTGDDKCNGGESGFKKDYVGTSEYNKVPRNTQGRFPANIIFDEKAGKLLDQMSGISKSISRPPRTANNKDSNTYSSNLFGQMTGQEHNDKGGASRFFYCTKPSKSERNAGLDGFEEKQVNDGRNILPDNAFQRGKTKRTNTHPTVKPIKLMEYLVKLITPKNGIVLDPFIGSGTTGIACVNNNFKFIGFEKEEEYKEIADARIKPYLKQNKLVVTYD